ncbi:hypothetical protein [Nocardia brasiliensis]|uniref:hypothetical protein n=1 Tax=Nocardia brasiliensis TaxID=37326 RepID=UPI00366D68C3
MNPASPDQIGATKRFSDCLGDPGELTRDDATTAMSLHYDCSRQCLPLRRAEATLTAEYGSVPAASEEMTDQSWGAVMSARLRVAMRLSEHRPSLSEPT